MAFSPTAIMEDLNAGYSRRRKKDIKLQRMIHCWGLGVHFNKDRMVGLDIQEMQGGTIYCI